tara:strand:- start:356 stop:607 length:252 start_codon:yes stop_codon:yes gene_type:complete
MSSELHKYIETALDKKQKTFNAEVLNFPSDKKTNNIQDSKINNNDHWNINDSSNNDQLKAITGICLVITTLVILGVLANFTTI